MFRNLFRSNTNSGSRRPASRQSSRRSRARSEPAENANPFLANNSKNDMEQTVLADAERELYKFDFPTQELGLTELISKHKQGDRFQYLALTGRDDETYEARLRKIFTFRPKARTNIIPSDELPHIELKDDSETFQLSSILPRRTEKYVRISSFQVYFAPTMSVTSDFCKITFSLADSRFHPPAIIQSFTANSNVSCKGELSMDYYIPATSAQRITFMVTRQLQTITMNEQWGAVQAQVKVEESSFPTQANLKQVVGVLAPTATAIEDFNVDPNRLDITLLNQDMAKIRDMYQDEDIADEGEPVITKTKKTVYAKSSVRGMVKGTQAESSGLVREGWEHMTDFRRPQIEADKASVDVASDPDEDDIEPNIQTREMWEAQQEKLRAQFDMRSDTTEEIPRTHSPIPGMVPVRSALRNVSSSTEASSSQDRHGEPSIDTERDRIFQMIRASEQRQAQGKTTRFSGQDESFNVGDV